MMKHLTDENNLYVKYFIPYTGVCSYAVAYPGFQRGGGGGGGLRSGLPSQRIMLSTSYFQHFILHPFTMKC